MRVARLAGPEWVEQFRQLIVTEIEDRKHDKEEGILRELAPITLMKDILSERPPGIAHWRTDLMLQALVERHADRWGSSDRFPEG